MLKGIHQPRVTAVSLAVGVAIAFSPFLGFHLVLVFILSKIFRLNTILVLLGSLVHNPWTMLGIHLAAIVEGDLLLSGQITSIENFRMFPWRELGLTTMFSRSFWELNGQYLLAIFWPFFFGSLLQSAIFGPLTYHVTIRFLIRNKVPAREGT